jgi:hypothetical protein
MTQGAGFGEINDLEMYLKQLRRLKPEDAQPEVLTYLAWINTDGSVSYQSPSIRVTPGYMFACEQIKAGCPLPPQMPDDVSGARVWTMPEFLPFLGFNVLNEGRQKAVFKLPLAMNMFVNALGSTEGIKFRTPITFFEGADIAVNWFTDRVAIQQTWPNGPGTVTPRVFNPGQVGQIPRVELYAYLIGSIVRAETLV